MPLPGVRNEQGVIPPSPRPVKGRRSLDGGLLDDRSRDERAAIDQDHSESRPNPYARGSRRCASPDRPGGPCRRRSRRTRATRPCRRFSAADGARRRGRQRPDPQGAHPPTRATCGAPRSRLKRRSIGGHSPRATPTAIPAARSVRPRSARSRGQHEALLLGTGSPSDRQSPRSARTRQCSRCTRPAPSAHRRSLPRWLTGERDPPCPQGYPATAAPGRSVPGVPQIRWPRSWRYVRVSSKPAAANPGCSVPIADPLLGRPPPCDAYLDDVSRTRGSLQSSRRAARQSSLHLDNMQRTLTNGDACQDLLNE